MSVNNQSGQAGKKGISIHLIHVVMIVLSLLLIAVMVFSSFQSSDIFSTMSDNLGKFNVRQKAAHQLMEASDYLTEMVQRFTLDGDMQYLNNYFNEADNSKSRESAVKDMADSGAEQELVARVEEALNESKSLMNREYYAMKLVIDAKEYWEYPEVLNSVELSEEDEALSAEDKMDKAQDMVMDTEYFTKKGTIRADLKSALDLLEKSMETSKRDMMNDMNGRLSLVRIATVVLAVMILIILALSAKLGTLPLIRAVEEAKAGRPVPETGSREFREMAARYNDIHQKLYPGEEKETGE